jgi:XTP/dITP diphosphohydrolase
LISQLALATGNAHKIHELKELLSSSRISSPPKIYSPNDCGISSFSPMEDGLTFAENSAIKSKALFALTGIPSLADDSGISVDALDGRPGIYSARYGGEGLTDKDRALKLLQEMKSIPNRSAHFDCVLSFTTKEGTISFEGRVSGEIADEYDISGNGFGYDPIFFYPPLGKCFSAISLEAKNNISHRAQALQKFVAYLAESTGPPVRRL